MKAFQKLAWTALAAAMLFTLLACASPAPAAPAETAAPAQIVQESVPATAANEPDLGYVAPFTTKDTAGNEVTDAVFANADVTMLNVWATFCGYCIREMPELSALNKEFADRGFQVIGLVGDVGDYKGGYTEADMAAAASILDKAGADFPTLMPSAELIGSVLSQVTAYPTTLFVDRDGHLLGKPVLGAMGEEFWRGAIEAYLAAVPEQEAQG